MLVHVFRAMSCRGLWCVVKDDYDIFRINNVYHYQCIIKYKKDDRLSAVLREIDNIYKVNK